jgi:DNA-binding NarL/FixJ family response regulator
MSADPPGGTVFVVAPDAMSAARVEAALHALRGWRIHVGTPGQLRAHAGEHPETIVVLVVAGGDVRRSLRPLRDGPPRASVVALSDHPAALWTSGARALGLRASLPRNASPEELTAAVRAVRSGLFALHPEALVPSRMDAAAGAGAPLTSREREILELMAEGANNGMIATRLTISRHTVKFHVAAILAKLGARTRTEAVALALRRGLFTV